MPVLVGFNRYGLQLITKRGSPSANAQQAVTSFRITKIIEEECTTYEAYGGRRKSFLAYYGG